MSTDLIKHTTTSRVLIDDVEIPVEVATNPVQGLSDRDDLAINTGMLFDLDGHPVITMRGMKFSLDIIWIGDNHKVVDISRSTLISVLGNDTLYSPKEPAVYALEINAGEAQKRGIKVGDDVEINLLPNSDLTRLFVLEEVLEHLFKEEQRDYDPKGGHRGKRGGKYFLPGERETGGKQVDVVQAPEVEVKDNPWDLTRKEFNKKYVWHHTSFDNAFQIQREGMKKGVFGIGGNREGFPGAVTIFVRRSDVEALNPSVESFGRGQALYPEGTYSPTKEWKTPLSPDKLFIVSRASEKDPYEFLVRQKPMTEEEMDAYAAEQEANRPKAATGGGITGPVDLTEKVSGVDLGMQDGVLYTGDASLYRYWYHKPRRNEIEGASDGGIKAYPTQHPARNPLGPDDSIWLEPGKPYTGTRVTSINDPQLHNPDNVVRIVDSTKLNPDNFIMANDGYFQHRGDIPFDAIVDQKQATDKTSPDNLSKLLVLETALDYLAKATPGERLEYLTPGEPAPGDTSIHTTPRGARGYYPSEVAVAEEETAAPSELEPEEEREVEVVQAPEAKSESSSDVKPRKKADLDFDALPHIVQRGVRPALLKIFHKGFKVKDFQDLYSTGLEDFSTEIMLISTYDAAFPSELSDIEGEVTTKKGVRITIDIKDNYGWKIGSMTRSFKRVNGELRVNHQSFILDKNSQGKGIAAEMNEYVEEEYEKLGVYSISLHANIDIGGYAWARQGYDFSNTSGPRSGHIGMKKDFIDKISQLSRGRRRAVSPEEYDDVLGHMLADIDERGDLQTVFEEIYPDQDWSKLNNLGDERLNDLWELEDEDREKKVLNWSELLEKIEAIRPSGEAPRLSSNDVVLAADQISKFKHAWEFANWRLNGEHLGKEFMLGSDWNAKKILDKESKGYQIGKEYFAAKRNKKKTS